MESGVVIAGNQSGESDSVSFAPKMREFGQDSAKLWWISFLTLLDTFAAGFSTRCEDRRRARFASEFVRVRGADEGREAGARGLARILGWVC